MQLTAILLLTACLQVTASAFGQKVTLVENNVALKKVFREIRKQTGYNFIYTNRAIRRVSPVTLDVKNASVEEVLNKAFANQPLTYTIDDNVIIVKPKPVLVMRSKLPSKKISGMVLDSATGNPLPGVSIEIQGTNKGVVTDARGKFDLTVNKKTVLVVSFLGYASQTIKVDGRNNFHILLTPITTGLSKVVVVGYGKQKEEDLTEAVSTISSKRLNLTPAANVGNMLAGKTTGLFITQRSGFPFSDAPTILIRGVSTLSQSNAAPLVIVDGVKRNFYHLNPNNIESISVLKDAAATAIYGIEGANGVILVTTKRGQKGPAKFSVNLESGVQQVVNTPTYLNSYQYASFYNQAELNDGVSPAALRFSKAALHAFKYNLYPQIYPNTNWIRYLIKPLTFQTRNSASVSGGTDAVKYYISMGYMRQDGIYKTFDVKFDNNAAYADNPSFTKYNFRSNLDVNVTPSTRVSLTAYGRVGTHVWTGDETTQWRDVLHGAPFSGPHLQRVPGAPPQYNLVLVSSESAEKSYYIPGPSINPLKLWYSEGVDVWTRNTLNMDLTIHQKLNFITKGLAVQFMASYDTWYQKGKNGDQGEPEYQAYFKTDVDPNAFGDSSIVYKSFYRSSPLTFTESYSESRQWYMEGRLTYDRQFGRNKVSGLLVYNQRRQYNPDSYPGLPLGLVGSVARLKENYADRYLLEVDLGYNGSENFAKDRRFGFFPAVSGAWIVTNEPFMSKVRFINYLKLRASYGVVGSDQGQGRFLYLPSTYYINGQSTAGYNFGYTVSQNYPGAKEGKIGNPDVTWETAKKQDYAIDVNFLRNRLKLSFEYFYQDRTGILATLNTVPAYVAASLPAVNLGEVKNHGYEASIKWNQQVSHDFSYNIGAHVTYARNKIVYMDEVQQPEPYMQRTGQSVGQPFGYVFDGFYGTDDFDANGNVLAKFPLPATYQPAPGYLRYKDLNGDGVINANDERAIGYPDYPEFTFGSNVDINYKNFSLITVWQGVTNVSRMFAGAPFRMAFGAGTYGVGEYGTFAWQAYGAWTPEKAAKGEKITYPVLTTLNYATRNDMDSNFWLHNGSYLRLKTAQLAYNLPQKLVRRWGLGNIQVYISGYDLLTFSYLNKYHLDPEQTAKIGDVSTTTYPITKVYNFGIHLDF